MNRVGLRQLGEQAARHGVKVALVADVEPGDAVTFDQFYDDLPKKGLDGRRCITVSEKGTGQIVNFLSNNTHIRVKSFYRKFISFVNPYSGNSAQKPYYDYINP